MAAKTDAKAHGRTAFRLVIEPGEARVRKKTAPPARPMTPPHLKNRRRRPDFLAEAQDT